VPTERRLPLASLAVLLLVLGSPSGRAADTQAAGDNRPIAITAQNGIEWQKAAQIYVARGNAVATRDHTVVRADTLIAHYRPEKGAEGGNEVYRLDADGHVVITNGADAVTGDQAVYDVAQQTAVVTGKHLRLTTPSDVVTARDTFEWYDQQQLAVGRGDAVATRGDRRIRADVLTAHLTKEKADTAKPGAAPAKPGAVPAKPGAASTKPGGSAPATTAAGPGASPGDLESSRISRIDAEGNVVVTTPTDIARGDYGVYDAKTDIATLIGHVTITRGQNVIRGQYGVVDLKTNVSRMMTLAAAPGKPASQVEGLFVRQDAAAKPAAPPVTGKPVPTAKPKP
jgi:lipopolysaccharide export system protein LptA